MPSCKEVSVLASKALDTRLSWRERWGLKMHLLFCVLCRRYVRQLQILHKALEPMKKEPWDCPEDIKLSEKARQRIRRILEQFHEQ